MLGLDYGRQVRYKMAALVLKTRSVPNGGRGSTDAFRHFRGPNCDGYPE